MERMEMEVNIVKLLLGGIAKRLVERYGLPEVEIILHEALHQAVRETERKERGLEIPEPVTIKEAGPQALVSALNYQTKGLYRLEMMSAMTYDVAARTLAQATLSLKGKCLFCDGNLQVETLRLRNGTKRPQLSCLNQNHIECQNYVWQVDAAEVPR